MREQLEAIRDAAMGELGDGASAEQIEAVRVRVLGRAGELTDDYARDARCPGRRTSRHRTARQRDQARDRKPYRGSAGARRRAAMERSLAEARLDVTLPGTRIPRGRLHPLTLVPEQMLDIFAAMGFEMVATQDVEDDFHNF